MIVEDIRRVQKNRGDSDTRHMGSLIKKDTENDITVPSEVVESIRKRSPKKRGMFDEEDMSGVENVTGSVDDGVSVNGDDEVPNQEKEGVSVGDGGGDVPVQEEEAAPTIAKKKARVSSGGGNKAAKSKVTSPPASHSVISREMTRRPLGRSGSTSDTGKSSTPVKGKRASATSTGHRHSNSPVTITSSTSPSSPQ